MKIHLLLSLFFSLIFQTINAQEPNLLDREWMLEKVTLNTIEHIFPNTNPSIIATANFTSNTLSSTICNTLSGNVSYSNQIHLNDAYLTLASCSDPSDNEYNIFEDYYFGQFFGSNTIDFIYSNYNYLIENIENSLRLTLINPNGDTAIYWSENLAIKDDAMNEFKIYPNPVENIFTIESDKLKKEMSVTIFNNQGKTVLRHTIHNTTKSNFNLSTLFPGLYILNIKTEHTEFNYKLIKK